jgi:hypothetical protein
MQSNSALCWGMGRNFKQNMFLRHHMFVLHKRMIWTNLRIQPLEVHSSF